MIETGDLYRVVWDQTDAPAKGVEIKLDDRQSLLLVTGSEIHIKKIESLLQSISMPPGSVNYYRIRTEDGTKIKELIDSQFQTHAGKANDPERKIIVDGEYLVVIDVPENITKIEELLTDKQFIQNYSGEKPDIHNFSLAPPDRKNIKSDQLQAFTNRVLEAIDIFLYSEGGKEKAEKKGGGAGLITRQRN
jgi:hypothetical protein